MGGQRVLSNECSATSAQQLVFIGCKAFRERTLARNELFVLVFAPCFDVVVVTEFVVIGPQTGRVVG